MKRCAVGLVAVAVMVAAAGCADEPSEPDAVFEFGSDSVCDWFTARDLNEIVATAQRRAGTTYELEAFMAGDCDSGWRTQGFFSDTTGDRSVLFVVEPVDTDDEVDSDAFVGHRLLDDEVSYQIRTHQFSWHEGLDGYLRIAGHENEDLYFGLGIDDHDGVTRMTGGYDDLGLAMVNEFLVRMNWVGPTD